MKSTVCSSVTTMQGKLFADDASDSIPTLDLMGDGPVDDLPF